MLIQNRGWNKFDCLGLHLYLQSRNLLAPQF